jgi:hypothetical protein
VNNGGVRRIAGQFKTASPRMKVIDKTKEFPPSFYHSMSAQRVP